MSSKKDFIEKYYFSDIFNLTQNTPNQKYNIKTLPHRNRSTLENTKEEIFNIHKRQKIKRNPEKEKYMSNSCEKRRRNYEHIYGSDIFNLKSKSVERRKEKHHMPNITNRSTFFEEMKNNEEYSKDFKEYTREKRGDDKYNKTENKNNFDENNFRYHKKRAFKIETEKNNPKIIHRNENNKTLNYPKRHPLTFHSAEKRRFIGLDEFPENNCKINKQIQFESHIFTNKEDSYIKSKAEIQEINNRINQYKKSNQNNNSISQPFIRVNRKNNKNKENIFSSTGNLHSKIVPANMHWDNLESQVMFSQDYTKNLYEKYGPKGPSAYQRRLHQFADSDNLDTLSGLKKNNLMDFKYLKKPKNDEMIYQEEQKRIENMVENIPNLSQGKKLEFKMNKSVLDFKDENDWNNKEKDLNIFLAKPKKQKKEITDKVNNVDRNIKYNNNINNNLNYHDYTITYGIKGNLFDNYSENEIKNFFCKKGINVANIHKNIFGKGKKYNTINIKIVDNNNKNENINKKIKLIQDELNKNNYKIKIEKSNKLNNNIKNIVNNPGASVAIMKDNLSNQKGENKFKIMPKEYKARKGFTKQFIGINYGYKNPNQLF